MAEFPAYPPAVREAMAKASLTGRCTAARYWEDGEVKTIQIHIPIDYSSEGRCQCYLAQASHPVSVRHS